METTIQLNCFAGLRKFFGAQVQLRVKLPVNYGSLLQELKNVNPEASGVLDNCRIAVNEKFVHPDAQITGNDPVFLIPPSSGG